MDLLHVLCHGGVVRQLFTPVDDLELALARNSIWRAGAKIREGIVAAEAILFRTFGGSRPDSDPTSLLEVRVPSTHCHVTPLRRLRMGMVDNAFIVATTSAAGLRAGFADALEPFGAICASANAGIVTETPTLQYGRFILTVFEPALRPRSGSGPRHSWPILRRAAIAELRSRPLSESVRMPRTSGPVSPFPLHTVILANTSIAGFKTGLFNRVESLDTIARSANVRMITRTRALCGGHFRLGLHRSLCNVHPRSGSLLLLPHAGAPPPPSHLNDPRC
mmetsp:Transcript_19819/g.42193  ORF Transcript_19819/g.42193 Transcript_19819/m.42193 type:complete len:278 (+) Transcript_19819:234-1067(+)